MLARPHRQFSTSSEPLYVLIPCKSFSLGKSRLSSRLGDNDRRAFCELLLTHAIQSSVTLAPDLHIAVVTSDRDAVAIARTHGVQAIEDPGLGLNRALEHGRAVLQERSDRRGRLLVLPIDLPLAGSAALLELLDAPGDVVIAPDERGEGTNALALRSQAAWEFPFAYGDGSYSVHEEFARSSGWKTTTLYHSLLAFDVDEPVHYDRWKGYQCAIGSDAQSLGNDQRLTGRPPKHSSDDNAMNEKCQAFKHSQDSRELDVSTTRLTAFGRRDC